ncbi:MBL fold metallo-hydrolase [Sediminicola sp. 1XM1-17]|uniref:MBL fold metallo-hydrolase n=1 Tax=Sediminicola sp. 1XM1-17 TaxID=3127702 RepID=UPI0030786448
MQLLLMVMISLLSCKDNKPSENKSTSEIGMGHPAEKEVSLIILGTVQDAGSPHIACSKSCCANLFFQPNQDRKVVSLGIMDTKNNKNYIIEATPDFPEQAKALKNLNLSLTGEIPDGIFLTHAHIGHYTGLIYLGKEALNSSNVPVFAMPKMKSFLEHNGPWSQLVANGNIMLQEMNPMEEVVLTPNLSLIPFTVPHRDEYSETVGFTIIGPNKKVLFIPDIDKWHLWETNIIDAISAVDMAFIDATFYDGEEIYNRDITEIPHPFVIESMAVFKHLPESEKAKIHFIHLNHTNPLLDMGSEAYGTVLENGFKVANIKDAFSL